MAKSDAANAAQNTAQNASVNTPSHHLIVIHPFGSYEKGARIDDANEIAVVLAGENAGSCNRIKVGV